MIATSLCGVLLVARLLVLANRSLPLSAWSAAALFWQDLALVLLFAAVEQAVGRRRLLWACYALVVAYVALNLPLFCILASPLTWPMLRAARGPLTDSISYYLTWHNSQLMLIVAATACLLPWGYARAWARHGAPPTGLRIRQRRAACLGTAALILIAGGPTITRQSDTSGLERNPWFTLVTSALPSVRAVPGHAEWTASPFGSTQEEDLTQWQGRCAERNVILILLESTGAQYLRAYGAAEDPTPNLSELIKNSIQFDHTYCVYPESIKGLFSVLCSQYPCFDSTPQTYARVQTTSLPEVLRSSGYRTALFHSGRFMYLGMDHIVRHRGYEVLRDAGDIGGNRRSSFGIDESATVEQMLEWIDSLGEERFFLTYLPIAGHHPYATTEPGPFPELDERGRYLNAVHEGDAALGKLFCGLRARQRFDRTLFVIAGDHSEAFGQHDGNFGHTMQLYEENVRVPLFLVAPDMFHDQQRVRRMASLIDLAPTITDLLGVSGGSDFQGKSLLASGDRMALFYTDYSLPLVGLRDGPWKFLAETGTGRTKLFHLAADPEEQVNLADQFPARSQVYQQHLLQWSAAQKARIQGKARSALSPSSSDQSGADE